MAPRRDAQSTQDETGVDPNERWGPQDAHGSGDYYQPPLPFPGTAGSEQERLSQESDLSQRIRTYRTHLVEMITDVVLSVETWSDRDLAQQRAHSLLAGMSLDHVVLPRWCVEDLLDDRCSGGDCDCDGSLGPHLDALTTVYRSATGWSP